MVCYLIQINLQAVDDELEANINLSHAKRLLNIP